MRQRPDILFIGGGLANGLAAYRLLERRPDVSFLLLESGPTLGGNHTWSFHGADIADTNRDWITPFIVKSWDGTDVAFPSFRRTLPGRYHSIRSERFHAVLADFLKGRARFGATVADARPDHVILSDGERIDAGCVIDGRGWPSPADIPVAFQKFVGLDLVLAAPHGLTRPVIMDATVPQVDGYRFFYALPWDERRLLLEDTRYSDTPDIETAAYEAEIRAYAAARKWTIASIARREAAALPIPLGGEFPASAVPASGVRAGLFHMTTGYSFPDAARFADGFAALPSFEAAAVEAWGRRRALRHWQGQRFFRLVNRLLFRAAPPAERRAMLETFYRRSDRFIARFYAGRLSGLDRLRMFLGRPPVRLADAWRAIR